MRGHRVSSLMQGGNPVKHDVTCFKKVAYTKVNHIQNSLYGVKLLIRYLLTTTVILLLISQVIIGAGLGQATSSTGGRGWQDFTVIGDALVAFYPQMLGQLKEEYKLEALHNTVGVWIDYREGARFPAQWDVYVARLIREVHNVGLPIGVAIGYFVGDSVDARYNESVGFLHYYRQLIPDEQKWRYPNGTVALDPYSVGSSRSFTGAYVVRILGDPLIIERLKRLDLYSTMQPQNPYWKEFFIDWGKKAIDRGSDSFFIDNPDGIFTFFWGGGWGCTDTWEGKGLAEYLRAKLGDSNLRAMGVESPESFCLKDYLVKKYGSPRIFSNYVYFRERFKTSWPIETAAFNDVESILRDPIFKEALLYWYRSAIDFVRDAAAQYKLYASQRGRDIILTSNHFFAWAPHITLAPYMDALYLETNQIRPPPYMTLSTVCKLGQASVNGSKPAWIGEWILNFANPYEPSPPPRDISNLVSLRVAEAYASGCIMLVPFGTGYPSEGLLPTRLVEGSERPHAATYYRFISENRELFKGGRTKADVALLVSVPTMVWNFVPALGLFSGWPNGGYQKEIFGWARALESMGIPYDILLLGMDGILPTDSHTRLKSYSLIIAPELSHISDIHLQAILDFLKSGGRLIVGPSFGIYDEMHNPRPSDRLSTVFSHPNVLRAERWLGRDYQLTLENFTPSQHLLSLMKGAVETSLTSRMVITNASQNVYISILSQRLPDERLIVHLVNYDYRYDSEKDWTIPASNIGITLKIPPTFNPANVTLISPDIPSPIPLTFQLGDGSLNFTVPSLKVWDIIVIEDRTAVLQRALEDLQNRYKGLLQAYESLNASHAELSQSYAQLVQTQQKLLAELRAKNEAYAKLSEENQAIKAELESLRSRLDENRALKAELESLRGKLAELTQLYEDAVRERKQASELLLTYQYTAYAMAAVTVSSIAALAYSRIKHRGSHH
jgi:hypothetical protein